MIVGWGIGKKLLASVTGELEALERNDFEENRYMTRNIMHTAREHFS